jgi:hypothetical protein
MTDNAMQIWQFVLIAAAEVFMVGATIATAQIITAGGTEANPLTAWLFKKTNQAATCFIYACANLALWGFATSQSEKLGLEAAAIIAAVHGADFVWDFVQLKKKGLSFWK